MVNEELSGAASQVAVLQTRDDTQTLSEQGLALWRLQRLSPATIASLSASAQQHSPSEYTLLKHLVCCMRQNLLQSCREPC